jgi:hypothetical protein
MDFKKEKAWLEILCGIADLPIGLQEIVFVDIVESAKNRITTISELWMRLKIEAFPSRVDLCGFRSAT